MNKRLITLSAIIGLAALSRLLPHPPNVTPIAAMALFAGAHLRNWRIAFLLPMAAMFLSDLALGFTVYGVVLLKSQPVVYLCMMVTVGIGRLIENKRSVAQVLVATLISAVIFYIATNFAVWRVRCIGKILCLVTGTVARIRASSHAHRVVTCQRN